MEIRKGYDFDDLLLVPRSSKVNSRMYVSTSTKLTNNLKLDVPIIAAPMKGIVGVDLIIKLGELGGIGILHRFHESKEKWKQDIERLVLSNVKFGIAIGLDNPEDMEYIIEAKPNVICVDVANGYLESVVEFCRDIEDSIHSAGISLMAGNVADDFGYAALEASGVDLIRVGIGPGTLCTTRNVTGVGVPQLSAIDWCSREKTNSSLIADGGIRNSGDMVKALAMGADAVMIGSMFAKAFESEHNGIIYGAASRLLQEEYYHNTKSIEGIEAFSEKDRPLSDIIDTFVWGLRSACTYLDADNIHKLQAHATFVATGNGSIKKL